MAASPLAFRLRVASPGKRPVRLWLPVVVLWPLLALVLALPLLLALLVDLVLWLAGRRYHHHGLLIVRTLGLVTAARGTVIRINDGDSVIDLSID